MTQSEMVEEAVEILRNAYPKALAIWLFVNSDESEIKLKTTTPAQLKRRGVSMKTLDGEYLRETRGEE